MLLGEKIRALRESKGLIQRNIAEELNVDIAYISRIEHGEKPINRIHLRTLSKLFNLQEDELIKLWLADKIYTLVKDESLAVDAFKLAHAEYNKNKLR